MGSINDSLRISNPWINNLVETIIGWDRLNFRISRKACKIDRKGGEGNWNIIRPSFAKLFRTIRLLYMETNLAFYWWRYGNLIFSSAKGWAFLQSFWNGCHFSAFANLLWKSALCITSSPCLDLCFISLSLRQSNCETSKTRDLAGMV